MYDYKYVEQQSRLYSYTQNLMSLITVNKSSNNVFVKHYVYIP
jgi:hypothetical protein